jgi:hypothetical protein
MTNLTTFTRWIGNLWTYGLTITDLGTGPGQDYRRGARARTLGQALRRVTGGGPARADVIFCLITGIYA